MRRTSSVTRALALRRIFASPGRQTEHAQRIDTGVDAGQDGELPPCLAFQVGVLVGGRKLLGQPPEHRRMGCRYPRRNLPRVTCCRSIRGVVQSGMAGTLHDREGRAGRA